MTGATLHENTIADRIIDLIRTNLEGSLGLKVVTLGALELYPALGQLADAIPAVFVKPTQTTLERITTGQTYRIVYNFRIVFVKPFAADEEITRAGVDDTQKIAELLKEKANVDLGGLLISNGQILFSTLQVIEWQPPEDNLVATVNADATATAMVFTVSTTSRK